MLERLREVIRLRHYAKSTEKTYLHWTRRFLAYRRHAGSEGEPISASHRRRLARDAANAGRVILAGCKAQYKKQQTPMIPREHGGLPSCAGVQVMIGLEPGPFSPEKAGGQSEGGAKSGAVDAQGTPVDSDLRLVVERWPTLPEVVKADILAAVRAARRS